MENNLSRVDCDIGLGGFYDGGGENLLWGEKIVMGLSDTGGSVKLRFEGAGG